jgi:hypothetical protein
MMASLERQTATVFAGDLTSSIGGFLMVGDSDRTPAFRAIVRLDGKPPGTVPELSEELLKEPIDSHSPDSVILSALSLPPTTESCAPVIAGCMSQQLPLSVKCVSDQEVSVHASASHSNHLLSSCLHWDSIRIAHCP